MSTDKWLTKYTSSLKGKVVAITGSTGGLGTELCRHLVKLGASILMLNRNHQKTAEQTDRLLEEFPYADIESIKLNLDDIENVKDVCVKLQDKQIDYLILNAGIYNVPKVTTVTDYNNIFQVNFVSHYFLVKALLPNLKRTNGKVIAVSSIAHKYASLNENDVDYSACAKAMKVYGNSKRFLTYSLSELLKEETEVSFAVAHPGITLTNMTNHYPKAINGLVKVGIKLLFPSPRKAALNIVYAMFADCAYREWIGPKNSDIWGKPAKKNLRFCKEAESKRIFEISEEIFDKASKISAKDSDGDINS